MAIKFFKETFRQDVYQEMVDTEQGRNLLQTLVMMQLERGVEKEAAVFQAKAMIAAVANFESVRRGVQDAPDAVLEKIFADVDQSYDPLLQLNKMYFGLTMYQDGEVARMLSEGASEEDVFYNVYYVKHKDAMTAEELKAAIRDAMAQYDLSEPVLRDMARKMDRSGDYFATAAELGTRNNHFKCIAAMELFLNRKGELSVQEAANAACASVEAQAAADAVNRGLITRETAKKILIVLGITLVVVGVAAAVYYYGSYAALSKAGSYVITEELPAVFAEFATATTASGAPAIQFTNAWYFKPLAEAARKKELIGLVTLLGGVGMAGLSKMAGQWLGKLQVAFSENGRNVARGMDFVVQQDEDEDGNADQATSARSVRNAELDNPQSLGAGV